MSTATATRTQTDEQIQKDVLAELKWDARVQPNEIGVSVKDGVPPDQQLARGKINVVLRGKKLVIDCLVDRTDPHALPQDALQPPRYL